MKCRPFPPALGLVAALALAPLAGAQELDPMFRDFEPTGDYVLKVDGKDVAAEIYQSEVARSILIVSAAVPGPAMFNLQSRQLEAVPKDGFVKSADGDVDFKADTAITPVGPFTIAESLSLQWAGKAVELAVRASLTGLHSRSDIVAYSPSYGQKAKSYQPAPDFLTALKSESRAVRVRVYFNSKCQVCKQMVPKVLKLEELLAGTKWTFEYYGFPDRFSDDPVSEQANVHSVPTAVVFVDGKEAGRIAGGSWKLPEMTLKNLLVGVASGG
jgi:thiol-disulfide isomerase/thioredoxin